MTQEKGDLNPDANLSAPPDVVADDVTKRLDEALAKAKADDTMEVAPQIVYGISIFYLSNGKPHVVVTGAPEPSLLELQMLLAPALANIEGDITAAKVVKLMQDEAKARHEQMVAQQMRQKLSGR